MTNLVLKQHSSFSSVYNRREEIISHVFTYSTAQLQLHFYTREHAWCHAVFRVLIPKIAVEIYISTRRDVAFTRDVEFTRDGNVTLSRDEVVLTKLGNWQDSTCL